MQMRIEFNNLTLKASVYNDRFLWRYFESFRFLTYDTYFLQLKFIYYAEYIFATQLLWNTR